MVIELVCVRVKTRNLEAKYSSLLYVFWSSFCLWSNEDRSSPIMSTTQHAVYKATWLSLASYHQATGELSGSLLSHGQESSLLHTDLLCITRDSVPSEVQYLESWLTEEAKQIPRACWTDKDAVATVKTTTKTAQPELAGFVLSEAPSHPEAGCQSWSAVLSLLLCQLLTRGPASRPPNLWWVKVAPIRSHYHYPHFSGPSGLTSTPEQPQVEQAYLSASPRPREVFLCRVSRTTAIPSGSRFRRRV